MRKTALVIGFVLALVIAGTAIAANPFGKASGKGRVDSNSGLDTKVEFKAEGTSADGAGKGKVKRTLEDAATGEVVRSFYGKVTCYFQDGNLARFSGEINKNKVDDEEFEGQFFMWVVVDNGKNKEDSPDMFGAGRFLTQPDCQLPLVSPTRPVDQGDFKVEPPKP